MINFLEIPTTKEELNEALRNCKNYEAAYKIILSIERNYEIKSKIENYDEIKEALQVSFNLDVGYCWPSKSYNLERDFLISMITLCRNNKY